MSPMRRENYPPDWEQIRARIRDRAGDRCERCGVPNHDLGYRDDEGAFVLADSAPPGRKLFRTVCTVAHVYHDLSDNRDEVLAFWCQRCHIRHDDGLHAAHAAETKRRRRGQLGLFAAGGA
jgi:hypothetical protein